MVIRGVDVLVDVLLFNPKLPISVLIADECKRIHLWLVRKFRSRVMNPFHLQVLASKITLKQPAAIKTPISAGQHLA